jgi:hypothetical protein
MYDIPERRYPDPDFEIELENHRWGLIDHKEQEADAYFERYIDPEGNLL